MKLSHSRMPFVRAYFREPKNWCSTRKIRRLSSTAGSAGDLRWQGAPVQSPLSADVLAPFDRTGRLYARLWLGEGPGRNFAGCGRKTDVTRKAKVRSSMRQLQNNPKKILSFYQKPSLRYAA
jgi:hypothetical protein